MTFFKLNNRNMRLLSVNHVLLAVPWRVISATEAIELNFIQIKIIQHNEEINNNNHISQNQPGLQFKNHLSAENSGETVPDFLSNYLAFNWYWYDTAFAGLIFHFLSEYV